MRAISAATIAALLTTGSTVAGSLATADAAPAATAATATPVQAAAAQVVTVAGSNLFSPNSDGRKDVARYRISLDRRAVVTVAVLRQGRSVTLPRKPVRLVRLGALRAGTHTWKWDGRRKDGRRAADGSFDVVVKARLLEGGAVEKASTVTTLDTVYRPGRLAVTGDTVYPATAITHDRISFRALVVGLSDRVVRGTLRITGPDGDFVYSRFTRRWREDAYPVAWDGRDEADEPLAPGRYSAVLTGMDRAGNRGRSKTVPLAVSGAPLVEATGSATLEPAATSIPPVVCGPESGSECELKQCGEVVPSTVYTEPGALSYRSSSACTEWWRPHSASRGHLLTPEVDAPRGLSAAQVAMRGRPTVEGETDQAELYLSLGWLDQLTVVTEAVAGERTTTTPLLTSTRPASDASTEPPSTIVWAVQTTGDNSYDVAEFKVDYTYLTPQP